MSEKVFDNAREVFRELFDTGQNYESRISDLTKEKLELSTKFEEMKQDFIYNLNIIKELEERIRDSCSNVEAQNKKYGFIQVELSDEKVKNKQLEDRLSKIENEFENCKKELNTNQRLHSSLVTVQQKQHYKMVKNIETEYEEKLKLLNEKNHELEISLESKIQSNKICAQQDLSRSRHEWNKTRADYENKIEIMNLNLISKNLELETSRKQIEDLQLAQETFSDEVKSKMFEINSLKLLLEEERSITADYTNQANSQLKALEQQNSNLKYEYESKINLLDKQLRIRKVNMQDLKSNFETEREQLNQARLNLETLLHQEQVILSNLKDEYTILKEDYESQKNKATQKRSDEQKLIVEFGIREENMLKQIQYLQRTSDENEKKMNSLEECRKESLTAYRIDADRAEETETQLRIQIQRLKSSIKEMKEQMEDMTSDEERRLSEKENQLQEREDEIIKQKKILANNQADDKNNGSGDFSSSNPCDEQLANQLRKSIEQVHVLRNEKDRLLDRCNKLQAEIRKMHRSNEVQKREEVESRTKFDNIENLQYDLTKQKLGLIALQRPYLNSVYSEEVTNSAEDFASYRSVDVNESFLDSEISSFPDLDKTSNSTQISKNNSARNTARPPKKPKSKKPHIVNYNSLRQNI